VIGRDSGGILVKSGDTFLRLTRWAPVQPDGSLGAATVPNALRGQRLGRDLKAQLARAEARIALLESRLGAGASGD
jgi:methionyl-tRNA formyltransferase